MTNNNKSKDCTMSKYGLFTIISIFTTICLYGFQNYNSKYYNSFSYESLEVSKIIFTIILILPNISKVDSINTNLAHEIKKSAYSSGDLFKILFLLFTFIIYIIYTIHSIIYIKNDDEIYIQNKLTFIWELCNNQIYISIMMIYYKYIILAYKYDDEMKCIYCSPKINVYKDSSLNDDNDIINISHTNKSVMITEIL